MAVFNLDPSVIYSILAVLAPAAVFFIAYGRYDGAFRDNVVFLYFMGGVLMGFLLGFLTILALGGIAPLLAILLLALLYPISLIVGINRRKWQGERHAVFNGGAFGIGVALMLGFTFLYVLFRRLDIGIVPIAQAVLFTIGLACIFFGLGLIAGNAVRLRRPFRSALLGTAIVLVPVIFIVSFVGNVSPPAAVGAPAPWNVEAPLAEEVEDFGGGLSYALYVSDVWSADATGHVRLVNESGAYVARNLSRADVPANLTFDGLRPGDYRVEAWIDGAPGNVNGEPEALEEWGVLFDGGGARVSGNAFTLASSSERHTLDYQAAPDPAGWTTEERLVTARETPPDPVGSWLWPSLLAAYGLVFAFAAEQRVLIHGVSEEARKARRRKRRALQ